MLTPINKMPFITICFVNQQFFFSHAAHMSHGPEAWRPEFGETSTATFGYWVIVYGKHKAKHSWRKSPLGGYGYHGYHKSPWNNGDIMEIKWGYGRIICQWLSMISGCVVKLVWKCVIIKGDITGKYSGYHGIHILMQTTVPYFRQTSIMFLLKHAIYWNMIAGCQFPHIQMVSWCFMDTMTI